MTGSPPETPGGDGLEPRVERLESGQTSLHEKVDRLIGFFSSDDPPPGRAREAEPPAFDVAGEIRRQLDERDRKKKPETATADAAAAAVTEKQPRPVSRRVEKIMGWDQ